MAHRNTHHTLAITLPIHKMCVFCQTRPIKRLAIFGSVLRADFTASSDVDLLVVYDDSVRITLLDMAADEATLSRIIGRKVDLRTPAELSRYFRAQVIQEAVIIYEQA